VSVKLRSISVCEVDGRRILRRSLDQFDTDSQVSGKGSGDGSEGHKEGNQESDKLSSVSHSLLQLERCTKVRYTPGE